MRQAYY
jgi:hypothetical protein